MAFIVNKTFLVLPGEGLYRDIYYLTVRARKSIAVGDIDQAQDKSLSPRFGVCTPFSDL